MTTISAFIPKKQEIKAKHSKKNKPSIEKWNWTIANFIYFSFILIQCRCIVTKNMCASIMCSRYIRNQFTFASNDWNHFCWMSFSALFSSITSASSSFSFSFFVFSLLFYLLFRFCLSLYDFIVIIVLINIVFVNTATHSYKYQIIYYSLVAFMFVELYVE